MVFSAITASIKHISTNSNKDYIKLNKQKSELFIKEKYGPRRFNEKKLIKDISFLFLTLFSKHRIKNFIDFLKSTTNN
jgi:hypothetical protein